MTLMKLLTRKLSLTPNQWNQSPKTAVLLLNMGGPNNAEEVRPYLQELFLDEEILKLPVQPLLGRFIAWRRTPAIIKRYEDHLGHYSPTDKWFKLQGAALENKMDKISPLTAPHKCYSAFRYAEPRTPTVINELKAEMESIDKIVLFSQYPQHSCSTSGSSLCDAYRSMKKSLGKEESSKVSVIDNWYSFPGYAELWTGMIESKLASLKEEHGYGNEDIHVVYSAHSLPEAYIYEKGDQYANEIQATVDLVHKNLGEFKHTASDKYGGSASDGTSMDNKKFSKMCKETKIMNKSCTSTDVDIVFTKVKSKGTRVITFDQCCEALNDLAKKRFKGDDNGQEKCFELMAGKSPGNVGTTKTSKTGGVSKMTDTSQYTGAHKERFGADGQGKGLAGRENLTSNTGYVGNYKGDGTFDKK